MDANITCCAGGGCLGPVVQRLRFSVILELVTNVGKAKLVTTHMLIVYTISGKFGDGLLSLYQHDICCPLHRPSQNILCKVYFGDIHVSTGQIAFTNYQKPVRLLRVSLGLHQSMKPFKLNILQNCVADIKH